MFTREFTGLAVLPVGLSGPVADALVLVEPETGWANVLFRLAIDAGVEDVADGGIGMGVEAVQARAQVVGTTWSFCRTEKQK